MRFSSVFKSLLVSASIFTALPAFAGDNIESIVTDGSFFGEMRYRYESVNQNGPAPIVNDANAATLRTNVGFKTGEYKKFQALIEAQIVQNLGANDFNDTVNRQTTYPVVADPDVTEINELWMTYSGLPDTVLKVGRQKVNLDNQRFVGTVNWRQNDQTYDAATIINSSIPDLNLMYVFVGNVNRIQGGEHALGDLNTETHLAHANYQVSDWLNVTGYGYWLDIDLASTLSSKTYGLRLTGDVPINDEWTFFYEAEAATQSDYGNDAVNYDENYYLLAPGVKGYGWSFQLGYEELGGNGTNAFQTPLATGHKFNGWADKFLTTPNQGLQDSYLSTSYKFSGNKNYLDGLKITGVYHEFNGGSSGNFGSEINLAAGKKFTLPDAGQPFNAVNVLLKYADYNADDAPFTDTEKLWLQVGIKF